METGLAKRGDGASRRVWILVAIASVVLGFIFAATAAGSLSNERFLSLSAQREQLSAEMQDAAEGLDGLEYGTSKYESYDDLIERDEELIDQAEIEYIPMLYEITVYVVLAVGCIGLFFVSLHFVRSIVK